MTFADQFTGDVAQHQIQVIRDDGVRRPHECKDCADEPSDAEIALLRIHDYANKAHTQDDGHCFALSEIVAMCRAALWAEEAKKA